MEQKKIIIGFLVIIFILGLTIIIPLNNQRISYPIDKLTEIKQPAKQNYLGMAMLGVYPNAPSREPTEKDFFTGVRQGNILLYESHSFEKGDYGKTFLVRIN